MYCMICDHISINHHNYFEMSTPLDHDVHAAYGDIFDFLLLWRK